MFDAKHYKPAIALALSLSTIVITPLASINSASAQLFPSEPRSPGNSIPTDTNTVIPAGSQIPLEYEKDKILVTAEETVPITLTVAADIRDRSRNTLIPYGTQVEGQIEPARGGGSRFVAQELIFSDGTRQYIDATSAIVTRTETVKRGRDTGDVLKGAAIGAAAAAVLGEVFGDINIEEVLGGAGLGALGGLLLGGKQVELISIDPNQDLDITLESDLALR